MVRILGGVILFLLLIPGLGSAQRTRTMNLERLIDQAGMIFSGRVIDVTTGSKGSMNLYVTRYTFEVLDAVYGVTGDTITIKQYGGEAEGRSFYPPGVPRFRSGEEVLVMMYPPSKIGMTSTVGKDQGKFLIQNADSLGGRNVINKLNNRGLFRRLRYPDHVADQSWVADQSAGPLEYDVFLQTLRNLVPRLKDPQ